jgi:hypothetical protein
MAELTGPMGVFPVDTDHRSATAAINPGTRGFDENGNEYTYVLAGGVIPVRSACVQGAAANTVVASSAAQQLVRGIAETAFASGEYGFILTRGYATALVVNSTAAGSLLATGSVAGTLELAEATDLVTRGIAAVTSSGSSATAGATVYLA